jgi:hypothetical protein
VTCSVYNKTVPDDDFIKSKHVVIKTQVFLLVVLTDKIKSINVKMCKLKTSLQTSGFSTQNIISYMCMVWYKHEVLFQVRQHRLHFYAM